MFVKTVCIHHNNKTVTGHYANKLENHQNKIKKKSTTFFQFLQITKFYKKKCILLFFHQHNNIMPISFHTLLQQKVFRIAYFCCNFLFFHTFFSHTWEAKWNLIINQSKLEYDYKYFWEHFVSGHQPEKKGDKI